jgi:hypothetical protein
VSMVATVETTAPAAPVSVTQDLFIRCAQCQAESKPPSIEAVLTLPSREVILWCRRHEIAIFKVGGETKAGRGLMLLAVYEQEAT